MRPTRLERYLATEKGKATIRRKREREKAKRQAKSAGLKEKREQEKRELAILKALHSPRPDKAAKFAIAGFPNRIPRPDDVKKECIEAGETRWSESIHNPRYRAHLAKVQAQIAELEAIEDQIMALENLDRVIAELKKILAS